MLLVRGAWGGELVLRGREQATAKTKANAGVLTVTEVQTGSLPIGRSGGISATAAKCAAFGRGDGSWVDTEENRQRQKANAGVLRWAQNDGFFMSPE
jgi:hypothetical protein